MIAFVAASVLLLTAGGGAAKLDPEVAPTSAKAGEDPDPAMLRDLDLIENLELLENLPLFEPDPGKPRSDRP